MKKKLAVLLTCACFAALLASGCADKSTKVSSTPGDAPSATTSTPATTPGEQAAQRPVEESTQTPSQTASTTPGTTPDQSAASSTKPAEPVVTPAAPTMKVELLKKIHFEYDKSAITPEAKAQLDKNYDYLAKNGDVKVLVVGHCDERGTNEYNMALGDRRANSTKSYLVNRGIAAQRLDTLSKGEEEPLDPGHDETAWGKNRRAEFLVK